MSLISCSGSVLFNLRTPRLIRQHPGHRGDSLRNDLHFLVVDLVRRVRRPVIIRVQSRGEECDRDSHLGEVVMVAAVEDPLPARLRSQIVVRRVRRGRIVEVIQLHLLIVVLTVSIVFSKSSLETFGPTRSTSPGFTSTCVRVGIRVAFPLGPADHVHIQIRHHLAEYRSADIG